MKTNKSITKRIKITKNGKLVVRKPGQNHFNAKESRAKQLNRKRMRTLTLPKRIQRRIVGGA